MPLAEKMNELAARKRLLVAESELNRHALTMELSVLSQKTARFERWALLGWKAYSLFRAGFQLAKNFRPGARGERSRSLFGRISDRFRFARDILGLGPR